MDLRNLNLFQMTDEKMRWLAQRQTVLSKNIANADTPNYLPSDLKPLKFKEFLGESRSVPLVRTNPAHRTRSSRDTDIVKTDPNHMSPTPEGKAQVKQNRRPFESSIDKNGVILEEQMAKVDTTRSEYDRATALFKKNASLIGVALRGNR